MSEQTADLLRTLRSVLIGLAVMGVVGVVLGVLVGGVATRALHNAGLGQSHHASRGHVRRRLPSPTHHAPSAAPTPPRRHRQGSRAVLTASPSQVPALGRINLDGRLASASSGDGLTVQRKENGIWVNFPVTMTAQSGGAFHTYVQTGRTGVNVFRVLDRADGHTSPPARVTVG